MVMASNIEESSDFSSQREIQQIDDGGGNVADASEQAQKVKKMMLYSCLNSSFVCKSRSELSTHQTICSKGANRDVDNIAPELIEDLQNLNIPTFMWGRGSW